MRILFITKKRTQYGHHIISSSGLFNSARYIVDMLNKCNIEAKLADVHDNNDIDREVHSYKPSHVIIEALWVVPEKFDVLKKLHPSVKWCVRIHSNIPFLSQEGTAMQWLYGYVARDILIGANNYKTVNYLQDLLKVPIGYLPNYYPQAGKFWIRYKKKSPYLHVGCFGAIRPLKNQLSQAMAAIRFAEKKKKALFFHINIPRIEGEGAGTILKNLRQLFDNSKIHYLVEHSWEEQEKFFETLDDMNIAMQVSFSESFNIISADAVNLGVPVVVSPEIEWVFWFYKANPTSIVDIIEKLGRAYWSGRLGLQNINKIGLWLYDWKSVRAWKRFLKFYK